MIDKLENQQNKYSLNLYPKQEIQNKYWKC